MTYSSACFVIHSTENTQHLSTLIFSSLYCLQQRMVFIFTSALLAVCIHILISIVWALFSMIEVPRCLHFLSLYTTIPLKGMFVYIFHIVVIFIYLAFLMFILNYWGKRGMPTSSVRIPLNFSCDQNCMYPDTFKILVLLGS